MTTPSELDPEKDDLMSLIKTLSIVACENAYMATIDSHSQPDSFFSNFAKQLANLLSDVLNINPPIKVDIDFVGTEASLRIQCAKLGCFVIYVKYDGEKSRAFKIERIMNSEKNNPLLPSPKSVILPHQPLEERLASESINN